MTKRWGHTVQQKFYDSKRWKQCRDAYASEHPYCERCAAAGLVVPVENVHHKIHLTPSNVNDPMIAYSFDNLESLCHKCHYKEHYGKVECNDGYSFDAEGNLIHTPRSEQ